MSELLTAKDVELKIFKKVSFGGYSIQDVEEFLNQVAEDLESYTLRQNDQQRRVHELEEALKRHEAMKDTIKDALILAQQSAKDKEDEAQRQAEHILAKAEAKVSEVDDETRRRIEEAENTADDIVSAARTAAAQIIKRAEEMKEEAHKRLENVDLEIANRMADANEKANEIAVTARLEARRVTGKVKNEIEECKREMGALVAEKRRFLRQSEEFAASYMHMIEEATKSLNRNYTEGNDSSTQELGRVTLPFSHVTDSSRDSEAASS